MLAESNLLEGYSHTHTCAHTHTHTHTPTRTYTLAVQCPTIQFTTGFCVSLGCGSTRTHTHTHTHTPTRTYTLAVQCPTIRFTTGLCVSLGCGSTRTHTFFCLALQDGGGGAVFLHFQISKMDTACNASLAVQNVPLYCFRSRQSIHRSHTLSCNTQRV